LRSSSTGMKLTSIAPVSVASVISPELAATMNSTGTPSLRPSSRPRSAVTPRGSPLASLTTKKAEAAGAKTTPTRSLPVGMSSLTALLSCVHAGGDSAANNIPLDLKHCQGRHQFLLAPDVGAAGGDTTISLRHCRQRALVPTISQAGSPDTMPRRYFGQVYPASAGGSHIPARHRRRSGDAAPEKSAGLRRRTPGTPLAPVQPACCGTPRAVLGVIQ